MGMRQFRGVFFPATSFILTRCFVHSARRSIAVSAAVLFGACAALGPQYFEAHTAFLGGVGNLPEGVLPSLSSLHPEPSNALSIPTWAIHFSSVFEWLFAMKVIWDFSEVTGNEKWKGMTWGMLPLHASGVCACFFTNVFSGDVREHQTVRVVEMSARG